MAQPTPSVEENIDNLQMFGIDDLDRSEIKQLLLNNSNKADDAYMSWLDSRNNGTFSSFRKNLRNAPAKWDETAFGGAAYGADDNNMPTFNIDYAPGLENYPHSAVNSAAPTRPPSRTSIASTQAQAGDAPIQSQSDLEGALIPRSLLRRWETQMGVPRSIENQESGVIGSNPNFGPATKDQYDSSEWALVPTASSTEVIADPIPSQRKREAGQPAILKPSSNFSYLSNLIPILHSIPQFRNALLCPGILQKNYWVGDDWWKGSPAETSRIIEMGRSEAYGLDILYEAQRLIAFLDKSDRIYGSVDAMIRSDAWRELPSPVEDPNDDTLKFLMSWGFAFESHVPDARLNGVLRSTFTVPGGTQESFLLDVTVTRDKSRPDQSFYEVLDDALFASAAGSAHIHDISDVLIFRATSSNTDASDVGCRIPATLYVDRYLEANKLIIDDMRQEAEKHEEELRNIQRLAEKIKYHTPKKAGAKRLDTLQMLRASMTAYEPTVIQESAENAATLSQLKTLYANIESKLSTLEKQTQQVRKTIAGISGRFKPLVDDGSDETSNTADDSAMDTTEDATKGPTESATEEATPKPNEIEYPEGQRPRDAMKTPYRLQGVATRRDVVYLRQPAVGSNIAGASQWWRMQYDSESSNPTIRRDRLTLEEVIERATTESACALLVYANPKAMTAEPAPLPEPLEAFVKKDNVNFLRELQLNITGWEDFGKDFGNVAQGGWDNNPYPPDSTDDDFQFISAEQFHSRERNNSNLSSATLTPNTEVDDAPEMVEMGRRASSETVGRSDDAMEVEGEKSKGKVSFTDVDMHDVQEEPRTQHIEVAEKKGG